MVLFCTDFSGHWHPVLDKKKNLIFCLAEGQCFPYGVFNLMQKGESSEHPSCTVF
jgi:hypothetical protein